MFKDFFGNSTAVETLERMIANNRIPQTLLIDGPEGVGKATLARRFAARLVGGAEKIEEDDLSRPQHQATLAEREKLPSDKRSSDPLLFGTHPDFLTFPPDGPLRQISIQQMRLLKERAQYSPLTGTRRVFLIDSIDRANEEAANSLLKTLEEPPSYLVLVLTAQNPYDLLPTIRSRAVPLRLTPLSESEMREFASVRSLDSAERRIALASGSPGLAATWDLDAYDKRREAMLALLESAGGTAPFSAWARSAEKVSAARSEKLEAYLKVLYLLLEDVLHLREGAGPLRNIDQRDRLAKLAAQLPAGKHGFDWMREAVVRIDEMITLLRRNIQKGIALDALVLELRGHGA